VPHSFVVAHLTINNSYVNLKVSTTISKSKRIMREEKGGTPKKYPNLQIQLKKK
jgi:hypothetical protein